MAVPKISRVSICKAYLQSSKQRGSFFKHFFTFISKPLCYAAIEIMAFPCYYKKITKRSKCFGGLQDIVGGVK